MVDPVEVIFQLQQRYVGETDWPPSDADISRWTNGCAHAETALYDGIGAELARGYHDRRYSFSFCDEVVNALFGLMLAKQNQEPPPSLPKLFWRVYEAFDAGEMANPSLPPYDPIRTNTDPEIAEIVRDL
jgi:hypothetical protein